MIGQKATQNQNGNCLAEWWGVGWDNLIKPHPFSQSLEKPAIKFAPEYIPLISSMDLETTDFK